MRDKLETEQTGVRVCDICGRELTEEDTVTELDGQIYCEDCAEEELTTCDRCDALCRRDAARNVEGYYWCENCVDEQAVVCDCCGNYIDADNDAGSEELTLCEHCRDEHYIACNDCGCLLDRDYAYWDEVDEEYFCRSCYYENGHDHTHPEAICGYSHKPYLYVHGEGPRYLGFEVEAGGLASASDAENVAEALRDNYDDTELYFTLKHDTSIPRHGFELVSQPFNLEEHKKYSWAAILGDMARSGLKSHDLGTSGCGMHIHVSKDALTKNEWIKADYFIQRNRREWELLARRPECHWAGFKKKAEGQKFTEVYGRSYGRYQAVNFTNRHTVEFRLFRGTLKYSTFLATLELVDALCAYVKTIKFTDLYGGNFAGYRAFVESHAEYAEAAEYIKEQLN